jgi:membrane protease YdiL (CAAX protease family)
MKLRISGFLNIMSKPQKIAGWVYLPIHMFLLPLLLNMLAVYLPGGLTELTANLIYYAAGFAFCLLVLWWYFRASFDILLDNLPQCLVALAFGYLMYLMLSYLAAGALLLFLGDNLANPNNEAVAELLTENSRAVLGLTVFVAPLVEELLFRGVIFGSLRQKGRFLAFAVSIAAFSLYHVWQFALAGMDWTLLLYAVQYIPAGYALAWAYEKTNSIWTPIFLHMLINGISLLVLG